jgi:hypothetical protein
MGVIKTCQHTLTSQPSARSSTHRAHNQSVMGVQHDVSAFAMRHSSPQLGTIRTQPQAPVVRCPAQAQRQSGEHADSAEQSATQGGAVRARGGRGSGEGEALGAVEHRDAQPLFQHLVARVVWHLLPRTPAPRLRAFARGHTARAELPSLPPVPALFQFGFRASSDQLVLACTLPSGCACPVLVRGTVPGHRAQHQAALKGAGGLGCLGAGAGRVQAEQQSGLPAGRERGAGRAGGGSRQGGLAGAAGRGSRAGDWDLEHVEAGAGHGQAVVGAADADEAEGALAVQPQQLPKPPARHPARPGAELEQQRPLRVGPARHVPPEPAWGGSVSIKRAAASASRARGRGGGGIWLSALEGEQGQARAEADRAAWSPPTRPT